MSKTTTLWIVWFLLTLAGGAVLVGAMFYGGPTRARLLIGGTTSGHHQIELACGACHTSAFGGSEEIEKTCHGCHDNELKLAKDSHPLKKFRDPRNADRLERLAANKCITCHTEHKPDITNPIGVTLPKDYCELCHDDVGKNRPSHKGLAFNTCASAGCHNYHDNTALYEDFLEKHAHEPNVAEKPVVKNNTEKIEIEAAGKALTLASQANAPTSKVTDEAMKEWLGSSHANAGVNCSGCHAVDQKTPETIAANWVDKPTHKACATCHEMQTATWLSGKHGMRLAPKMLVETEAIYGLFQNKALSPMRPEQARLPMQSKVAHVELGCSNCHGAHRYETKKAQVEACSGCHNDEHTQNYEASAHYRLWQDELAGIGAKGSGVSCATCHMPRQWMEDASGYEEFLVANHNQNFNLRPNEKMIRSACMSCHGLGFSIDSLADKDLIRRNFGGQPSGHIESIDWTMKRIRERGKK